MWKMAILIFSYSCVSTLYIRLSLLVIGLYNHISYIGFVESINFVESVTNCIVKKMGYNSYWPSNKKPL